MESVHLRTRVGADGILKLEIPLEVKDADLDVQVHVEPVVTARQEKPSPEDLGWPHGFFEEVAGGWQGERLERGDQGEYESRDELP